MTANCTDGALLESNWQEAAAPGPICRESGCPAPGAGVEAAPAGSTRAPGSAAAPAVPGATERLC